MAQDSREACRFLSDCFIIPGVLLAGVGAISWAGREGLFDMLAYGGKTFLGLFSRSVASGLPKSYYEYRQQKNSQGRRWLWRVLLVGGIFLAVGLLVFLFYAVTE